MFQQHVLEQFHLFTSTIRLLVGTTGFGMGVEINDIRRVIHWEKVQSLLVFRQEVGRCGHRHKPFGILHHWHEVLKVKEEWQCICQTILQAFSIMDCDAKLSQLSLQQACANTIKCQQCRCHLRSCCSHCRSKCQCTVAEQ